MTDIIITGSLSGLGLPCLLYTSMSNAIILKLGGFSSIAGIDFGGDFIRYSASTLSLNCGAIGICSTSASCQPHGVN